MNRTLAFLAALALAAAGCETRTLCAVDPGTPDPGAADVPADLPPPDVPGDGVAPDAPPADGIGDDVPDVPRDALLPAEYVPAGSFRFRMAGRDGAAFRVEVVARDFTALFGIALRVEWDPSKATLAGVETLPVFGDEGEGAAVYRAAEVHPGSLALGLTHRYYLWEADLAGDVVVATLRLRPVDGTPVGLSFYAPRSLVLDNDLGRVDATYLPAILYP